MRISDWSSDVCSSDLHTPQLRLFAWNEIADKHALAANALFDHRQVIRRQMQSSAVVEMNVPGSRVIPSAPLISSSSLSAIMPACPAILATRAEERSVGNECVSTCRSRWLTYN